MHPILQKTFGGLSPQYYFRQLFFSLTICAFFVFVGTRADNSTPIGLWCFIAICTFLYPYARFAYEGVIGFIVGENVFFVNAIVMLLAKVFTMLICWWFAIFIAPFGLAYLYYHHSKAER